MARVKKQLEIVGTEKLTIAEVEAAADAYREARDARMAAAKLEAEKHDMLVGILNTHDVREYEYADDEGRTLVVKAKTRTKVSVRLAKAEDVEDAQEEAA
jgi:CBS domain-containing protein